MLQPIEKKKLTLKDRIKNFKKRYVDGLRAKQISYQRLANELLKQSLLTLLLIFVGFVEIVVIIILTLKLI